MTNPQKFILYAMILGYHLNVSKDYGAPSLPRCPLLHIKNSGWYKLKILCVGSTLTSQPLFMEVWARSEFLIEN